MDEIGRGTVINRPRGAFAWPVMGLVAGLPVLYVLSFGLVLRLYASTPPYRTPLWVNVFYAPLTWLYEHTALHGPLDWYLALWGPF